MCSTHWSNNVRHMGHCGARGSSQVHDLSSRLDVDLVYSSQDGSCQLGTERVPGSVLNFSLSFLRREQNQSCRFHKTRTFKDSMLRCAYDWQTHYLLIVELRTSTQVKVGICEHNFEIKAHLHTDPLLSVHRLSDHHVLGHQSVLLPSADEHT